MSMKKLTLFLAILLTMAGLGAQEKQEKKEQPAPAPAPTAQGVTVPHEVTISAEDKARKNPVKFTEVSVERGKKVYQTQCALCHGTKGDGKGEMVEDMKINPPDFTKAETLKDRTDGELFAIIGAGKDPMPGQGGRMTDLHRWNLVNYLRSISGKAPEKASGKEPEENVILVPQ
jgi:mono/diheme cytochrome c family protein